MQIKRQPTFDFWTVLLMAVQFGLFLAGLAAWAMAVRAGAC